MPQPEYKVLIGMEIHVQLATASKMFTGAANGFNEDPNTQVDGVVLGLPGVLPVINRRAVEMAIMVGAALGCAIAAETKWDRKSYYYPDLPKNYQISQYDQPLCGAGTVMMPLPNGETKAVRIRRAHLEEDAGKLLHESGQSASLVDLNRAGTPLLEIVTEPDFSCPEEARLFGEELRQICRYLCVSQGIMQQGHMRFEPNINLHIFEDGKAYKTAITEVKNLNSFRSVERACEYEIQRQLTEFLTDRSAALQAGKSTRGWDDDKGCTTLQRSKEEAHDYRYFPDPDLVPLHVSQDWINRIKTQIPELPMARFQRYMQMELTRKEAAALLEDKAVADLFDMAVEIKQLPKRIANLMLGPAAKTANALTSERGTSVLISDLGVQASQYAKLAGMMEDGTVSASAAVTIFESLCSSTETDPMVAAEKLGLLQIRDTGATQAWVDAALANNPQAIADYKNNPKKKQASLGFLRGAVMKLSHGKADPKMVGELLEQTLEKLG